jgi:phosphoribosyl 1,2-cyclic phosphodiesterase
MKFRFWGVRGSIATPGAKTLKYGGNTTCIEVRGDHNELLVLDGGTGIFQLAQTLFGEFPVQVNIFLTHTHWDHIQGLPMFTPIFVPGNQVTIHGPADVSDPDGRRGIKTVLARQMEYAYFPVKESELKAQMRYVDLREHQEIQIGSLRIRNQMLTHPVLNYGYRIECNGKSLVFTGDYEWPYNIYEPEDPEYPDVEAIITEERARTLGFFQDADVLIIDTAYTLEEYPKRKGWGHGVFDASIQAGIQAKVKRLYLTHHEPTRSDDALEQAFATAMARNPHDPTRIQIELAREGEMLDI